MKDKFDMDAEIVNLDLDALISMAAVASRNALDKAHRLQTARNNYLARCARRRSHKKGD